MIKRIDIFVELGCDGSQRNNRSFNDERGWHFNFVDVHCQLQKHSIQLFLCR